MNRVGGSHLWGTCNIFEGYSEGGGLGGWEILDEYAV